MRFLLFMSLAGCASVGQLDNLDTSMTEEQVIGELGPPASREETTSKTTLTYALVRPNKFWQMVLTPLTAGMVFVMRDNYEIVLQHDKVFSVEDVTDYARRQIALDGVSESLGKSKSWGDYYKKDSQP